jgi:pimeloyl-ACP methyl ester carboxylesterase
MTSINPFTVNVPDETLEFIRQRVAAFPWHEMPDDGGWEYGVNLDYMKEFCAYWVEEYDWRKHEAVINGFDNFTAPIDGIDIHFIHEKGSGPAPMPLLITHGWPGSITEFLDFIRPLAHPEEFGGDVADAFDVVAPSVPGFGFSGKPPRPWGPRKIASVLAPLMTDVLGYDSYLAQGGDWGASITNWIGFEHSPPCKAIHVNMMGIQYADGPQTPEEEAWAAHFRQDQIMQAGYRTQQSTKPQTLSYAMMDSPVGTAAWILEKFHGWSHLEGDDVESAHTKDELLTNIMVYIVTGTFNTASWIYFGRREEGQRIAEDIPNLDGSLGRVFWPGDQRVEVPVACALFPEELLPWPPRSYVERMFNVQRWTEFPRGGHFGAMEEPEAMLGDIRAFARTLR